MVKSIYYSVKQVSDTLFSGSGEAFRKVLLVRTPIPRRGRWHSRPICRGMSVHSLDGEYVGVFIPTTPSPVNGFYFFVKKSDTIEVGHERG